jgi:hypothetical protein
MVGALPRSPIGDGDKMITIWAFNSAPPELKALYQGSDEPEWVMQVPFSLVKDLKESFVSASHVYSYEETMVYFGETSLLGFLASRLDVVPDDVRNRPGLAGGSPKR